MWICGLRVCYLFIYNLLLDDFLMLFLIFKIMFGVVGFISESMFMQQKICETFLLFQHNNTTGEYYALYLLIYNKQCRFFSEKKLLINKNDLKDNLYKKTNIRDQIISIKSILLYNSINIHSNFPQLFRHYTNRKR